MKHSSTAMTMTKATVFLLASMSFFPALTLAADAKIIQAAKSEGSLTLWTSSDLRTATALVQRFEKQYPFKGKRLPNGNWRTAQQDHDWGISRSAQLEPHQQFDADTRTHRAKAAWTIQLSGSGAAVGPGVARSNGTLDGDLCHSVVLGHNTNLVKAAEEPIN
jgi:hypothetical protein